MALCNCLDDALEKILERNPKWDNKKVSQYYYSNSGIDFKTGRTNVYIGIDIEYENKVKIGHTSLSMAFCPLCGKSLKEEESKWKE